MNKINFPKEINFNDNIGIKMDYFDSDEYSNINQVSDYDEIFLPEIDQINEKIFLGNYEAARFKDMLKMRGITHILICGKNMELLHQKDFEYLNIPVRDSKDENIKEYFDKCFQFIDKSDKVFVHCEFGVSRSPTIVIAYLMWKNKVNFRTALKFVMKKRKIINPNEGFMKQLKQFENEVFENNKFFVK